MYHDGAERLRYLLRISSEPRHLAHCGRSSTMNEPNHQLPPAALIITQEVADWAT